MNKNSSKIFSIYALFLLFYTITICPMDIMDYSTDVENLNEKTVITTKVNKMALSYLLNPATNEGENLDGTDLIIDTSKKRLKRNYDSLSSETDKISNTSNKRKFGDFIFTMKVPKPPKQKNKDNPNFSYLCSGCGKSFNGETKQNLVMNYKIHCTKRCQQKKMTENEFNLSEKAKILEHLNRF